ncbi:DUF6113 family protein [Microbacterium sp. W1N]|uniref:DUF6113 family protein n=1 Tax=Microbacterium festucae TaxID=2977531 RepID=UPI0021C135E5|nr:DUF6113 family protein [Microbacterium festucae]MCT9820468.1 DUF6113 family protein [Microbacterium festucae]
MTSSAARIGTWLVALVIGVVFGVAGTIGQAATWGPLPVGLVVAIVGVTALLVAVRLLVSDRWAAAATGIGATLAALVFSGRGPGGSVVVPAPVDGDISSGLIWTFAVPIITAIVVGWPSVPEPAPATEDDTI